MKTFISLFALFLSLSLTAQTNTATWYLNDTSGSGIQSEFSNTASGSLSVAMGIGTTASGRYSTAMGVETTASGERSTAMGQQTEASGDMSTAMGRETSAYGNTSTAMGDGATAVGYASTAIGYYSTASGWASTAFGHYTTASGANSIAIGYETTASDYNSLVLGQWNLAGSTTTNSPTEFSIDNTAFVIGNGLSWDNRGDALVVKFNGDATLAGNLNINSDARLKSNIISLGSTLSKLLQIDGKSYTMKKDESERQKIGLLAQDIEKVFPELVSESNGIKSVNYQGLVPVLINALKEQDAMMKEQESKYLKQEKRLERLERLVAAMD